MLSGSDWYQRYLKSSHWQEFREKMISQVGRRCQRCDNDGLLQVHHLTYERVWNELASDVLVLCVDCHMLKHLPDPNFDWSEAKRTKEIEKYVPEFDPEITYSADQLELLADRLLLDDPCRDYRSIHIGDQLIDRKRHEIYNANGVPDPSIESGLYWRTHPNGRAWNSRKRREETDAGFYRKANAQIMGRQYEWEPEPFMPTAETRNPKFSHPGLPDRRGFSDDQVCIAVQRVVDGQIPQAVANDMGVKRANLDKHVVRLYHCTLSQLRKNPKLATRFLDSSQRGIDEHT
jgi:hypothetical protein